MDCCSCTQTHNFTTEIKFLDGSALYNLETSTTCGRSFLVSLSQQCAAWRST